jgi:hypothetical protein
MILDLLEEPREFPPGFLLNYLVSAMMAIQRDVLFVHAGSMAVGGRGVILMGHGGAGKTTVSLALASRGHGFLGDNVACIRKGSRELLPFRRSAAIKPGPRARAVEAVLTDHVRETVRLPNGRTSVLVDVGDLWPASTAGVTPLRAAFCLRRFAERPAVEPFIPSMTETRFLERLSIDATGVFGVSPAQRMMQVFKLMETLATVRCYFLDVGEAEATAELVEKTVRDS